MSKEEGEGESVTLAIEILRRFKRIPCHDRMRESGDSRVCFLSWCESGFLILISVCMLTPILRLLGILLVVVVFPSFLGLLLPAQGAFLKITFSPNFRLTERYKNCSEISWITFTWISPSKTLTLLALSFLSSLTSF